MYETLCFFVQGFLFLLGYTAELILACVAGGISRESAFVLVAKPWTRVATAWEDEETRHWGKYNF